MRLPKTIHLILIGIVMISSIGIAFQLNWNAVLDASISFKELQAFLTSVFILFLLSIGFYYKPKTMD
ncbi:hypothetical protein G3567_11350 [Psychroflexus sp. YR1-1]|uniref:Uncharacterized protein n=2 Tax=Psychroflexus aurantiacus TaxID=2709310 RepID=A0A6B3R270_9FLAO|nr:hypothetical protein [Psychroflexus aurantiacus]